MAEFGLQNSRSYDVNGELHQSSYGEGPLEVDTNNIVIRRSDGDDCHALEQVIAPHTQDFLDLLYDYRTLIRRVECCFLSITITDSQGRVIGLAVFEDFPQGLEGMYDYLHENCWEQWLSQAFNIREEFDIRPFNSLWLVYFYLDRKNFRIDTNLETELLRLVFQNVYATHSHVEGINFLLRGDAVEEAGVADLVKPILKNIFIQIPSRDPAALQRVRGIHSSSSLYYSPRQKCFEYVEIRIAKQEDHDDLAEIFNRQSEVLTTQFGEFFIAELIAYQNENQKALVAQVGEKAVGLMSISKDIDYQLLAEGFELDQYDNLLRSEFMEAVKDRKDEIVLAQKYEEIDRKRDAQRKVLEEKMLTSHWGQRIAIQQHVKARETLAKEKMSEYLGNEELYKTLKREDVEQMLDEWLAGFRLAQPGPIFEEEGVKDPEVNCWVQSERDFFLETLTYFGLPKDYISGNGHWHDWAYNKLQERKQQLIRKQPRAKKQTKRSKKFEEKKEEEVKEPESFDLAPLEKAFTKFCQAGPDVRTSLRNVIQQNLQKFVFIFSNENGELLKGRNTDVIELGEYMKENQINWNPTNWEHISNILNCFGDLKFDQIVTKVMPQDESKKREEMKELKSKNVKKTSAALNVKDKNAKIMREPSKDHSATKDKEGTGPVDTEKTEEAKTDLKPPGSPDSKLMESPDARNLLSPDTKFTGSPDTKLMASPEPKKETDNLVEKYTALVRANEILEMYSSYEEILDALDKIKAFDQMMTRLGVITEGAAVLKNEVEELKSKEEVEREDELNKRRRDLPENEWRQWCSELVDLTALPMIPPDVHNAIAINLFCIDEKYESRSIDFLEYAFSLFPDRDYIILTQPHIVNESILLQSFCQIPKKKNAIFDDVLYIFHKDALLAPLITVRRSNIEDINHAQFLYAHMSQAAQIQSDALESIKSLTSNKLSFTVSCQDTIIGFYVLTKDVNLMYYKSHFAIQDFMVLGEHPRNGFSKIIYAILNPVFSKYTRYILKELMRLANKTCLFFEIHRDTALPDIFSELILTRNRKFPHLLERKWDHERDPEYMEKFQDLKYIQDGERDPMDEKEAPFSLAMMTKKLLSVNKINDNTRIVVVGASDTGISMIESLLSVRYVNFPHITLLAPGGMRAIHAKTDYSQLKSYSTNYTLVELRNLLLDSRITVIDARMVNIDRKNKTIRLDKQAILPYDVLVLTLGLCDTQLQDLDLVSEGVGILNETYNVPSKRTYMRGVYSIDDPYLYETFSSGLGKETAIARLTRPKRPENIVLYGRSLHMYCFINGLINRGVRPERITLVLPPKDFEKKIEFKDNEERREYEEMLVWNPPAFEDDKIEEKVQEVLSKLGVNVLPNLKLFGFNQDNNGQLESCRFKKYGENGEPIEKKIKIPVDEDEEGLEGESEREKNEYDEGEEGEEGEEDEEEEEEESDELEIKTKLLVTSRGNDIDESFFYAIHENGLVYNGRLIVKRNFQTTDPAIFAAGRLCEFSQRYKNQAIGTPLRLDKYSGREVGQKLARSIMEHIGLLMPEPTPEGVEEELPVFFMPMGVGGVLPNDLFYYYIRKIDWARPQLTMDAKKNREDIVCDNLQGLLKGHYIRFSFDNNGIIDSVTYLGSERVLVQSLVSFVGLSEKYLNKLDTRFKSNLIENVTEFLSENWAIALYHEWFSIFRHKTKMDIAGRTNIQEIFEKVAKTARKGEFLSKEKYDKLRAKISQEVTKAIEDGTLDFIRENLNHLPMYYIPDEEFK